MEDPPCKRPRTSPDASVRTPPVAGDVLLTGGGSDGSGSEGVPVLPSAGAPDNNSPGQQIRPALPLYVPVRTQTSFENALRRGAAPVAGDGRFIQSPFLASFPPSPPRLTPSASHASASLASPDACLLDTPGACTQYPSSFAFYMYPFGFSVGPAVTTGNPPGTAACTPRCARHPVHAVHPYDWSVKPLLHCLNDGVLPTDSLLDGCVPLVYFQGHVIVDCVDYRMPRKAAGAAAAARGGVETESGQIRDTPLVRRLLLRPTTASVQSDMSRHTARVAAAIATKAKERAVASSNDAARTAAAAEAAGAAVAAATMAATEQRLLVALYPDLQLGGGEAMPPPPATMPYGLDHAASAWSVLASTCEEARAGPGPGGDVDGRGRAAPPSRPQQAHQQHLQQQLQQRQQRQHAPPLVGTPIYSGVPIHGGSGSAAVYAAQAAPQATQAMAAEQQRRMFESLWDD